MEDNRERERRSLFFPLILITLGVIFLLSNLGILAGDVWSNIWNLWPLLLIAIGLDGLFRREGLVGAVLMVGLGLIFLMGNFGLLAINTWDLILRLWPILLIAVGFDIVVGRRSLLASLAGMAAMLILLFGLVWWTQARQPGSVQGETIVQPLQGAGQARVEISPGVASLRLAALTEPDHLVAGSVAVPAGMEIEQDFNLNGDQAVYRLSQTGSTGFTTLGGGRWTWEIGLAPDIPIDLVSDLGVGDARLDLTGLDLSGLQVNMGVGQVTITLPASGDFRGEIDGGIGQLVIRVPDGMALRIETDTGLTAVSVPPEYQRDNDFYTSPGYTAAENRVDLKINQAIGSVSIQQISGQ